MKLAKENYELEKLEDEQYKTETESTISEIGQIPKIGTKKLIPKKTHIRIVNQDEVETIEANKIIWKKEIVKYHDTQL